MNTSDDTDWEFFTLFEAILKWATCRQGGNETPNDFRRRVEERGNAVIALLGDNFLDSFMETTKGYADLAGANNQETKSNSNRRTMDGRC